MNSIIVFTFISLLSIFQYVKVCIASVSEKLYFMRVFMILNTSQLNYINSQQEEILISNSQTATCFFLTYTVLLMLVKPQLHSSLYALVLYDFCVRRFQVCVPPSFNQAKALLILSSFAMIHRICNTVFFLIAL